VATDPVSIVSTIISNNTATDDADISGIVNADHNLIQQAGDASLTGSNNILNVDPKLGTLGNHGGTTKTILPKQGSAAINAGSNPDNLTQDQRQNPREIGTATDIGAVEVG
jgi:hypothetical protein